MYSTSNVGKAAYLILKDWSVELEYRQTKFYFHFNASCQQDVHDYENDVEVSAKQYNNAIIKLKGLVNGYLKSKPNS